MLRLLVIEENEKWRRAFKENKQYLEDILRKDPLAAHGKAEVDIAASHIGVAQYLRENAYNLYLVSNYSENGDRHNHVSQCKWLKVELGILGQTISSMLVMGDSVDAIAEAFSQGIKTYIRDDSVPHKRNIRNLVRYIRYIVLPKL